MNTAIHPKWFSDCKVTCACGNTFTVGATVPTIQVEVCSNCHPFYTGQMKYLDTAGRVEAFKARLAGASKKADKRKLKREKKLQEELSRPETLEEVRKQVKKAK